MAERGWIGFFRGPTADIAGAFVVLVGLYLLSLNVQTAVLQIPGYLLVAFASLVRNLFVPGLSGTTWYLFVIGILGFLAVVLGSATYRLRTRHHLTIGE